MVIAFSETFMSIHQAMNKSLRLAWPIKCLSHIGPKRVLKLNAMVTLLCFLMIFIAFYYVDIDNFVRETGHKFIPLSTKIIIHV